MNMRLNNSRSAETQAEVRALNVRDMYLIL